MQNKENVDGKPVSRPCFFVFADKKNPDIFWCVPISSKVDKYQSIYDKKIERMKEKQPNPTCSTIRFGEVMGQKRVFLVQNMFPVTAQYISSVYNDHQSQKPLTIAPETQKDVVKCSREVLKLESRGITVVFTDIKKLYQSLSAELETAQKESDKIQESDISVTDKPPEVEKKPFSMSSKKRHEVHKHLNSGQTKQESSIQTSKKHNPDLPEQ